MSDTRITRWAAKGGFIGVLFSVLAITDARHFLPYSWHVSDRIDFYLCWWMILEFAPWHHSITLFYALVIFLNACTYALLFLIIGAVVRLIQKLMLRQSCEVNNG